jgi:hypothetical protein
MRYLNDASEFQFFVDMVKEAQEIVRPTQAGLVKKDILSDGVETLLGLTDLFRPEFKFLFFVASFTAHGDLLSQWRAYSHDEPGYSIGFSYSRLEQLAAKQQFKLTKCTYDHDLQMQILLSFLKTAVKADLAIKAYYQDGNLTEEGAESISRLFADKKLPKNQVIDAFLKNDPKYTSSDASLSLTMRLLSIGQGFKNPAFSEESEWRAVSSLTPVIKTPPGQMDNHVRFRPGKHMIVPYADFKLTDDKNLDLPIEEIIVGPSPHVELSRASVEAQLIGQNESSVKVKSSLIPYRPV